MLGEAYEILSFTLSVTGRFWAKKSLSDMGLNTISPAGWEHTEVGMVGKQGDQLGDLQQSRWKMVVPWINVIANGVVRSH